VPNLVRSSPAVAQDRDQGPDRGRGHRGAGEQERQHDSGGGERSTDAVREREREQPARSGQHHWPPPKAREIQLVAGEEEQHPQPEVAEELREVVLPREVEDIRADHDPEQQLEHHHGGRDAPRQGQRGERRHQGGNGDDQKRLCVNLDHLWSSAMKSKRGSANAANRLPRWRTRDCR
jgi:hypothetical protein